MDDLTGLGKIVDSKLAMRAYEDLVTDSAKQAGHLAADTFKVFRLFTAPIQLLATAQDRFELWLNKVRDAVPPERQVEAAPEIAGPVLMNLRFMSDVNELRELYLNLLKLAIDRDYRNKAHPGYVKIIEQLSPRDAHFLRVLSRVAPLDEKTPMRTDLPAATVIKQSSPAFTKWSIREIQSSLDLLRGLSVVHFEVANVAGLDSEPYKIVDVVLTQFGQDFVEACLPESEGSS